MRRALATIGMIALLAGATSARSADIIPQMTKDIRAAVLANMPLFVCGDASCEAATPDELANPPISEADSGKIVLRGMSSAVAEHCGLDWQHRSFEPMMAYWRDHEKRPVRQMAMIGGIHGMAQGAFFGHLEDQGPCTAELRATAEAKLDFRPEDVK